MRNELLNRKIYSQNGLTTEYILTGEDGPVIILINGYGMPLFSWGELYPEIKNYGRILLYNRQGVGKTSKALCPQTGEEIIKSLEKILKALNLLPPYIFVAHSLGGLYANLYARLKPTNVSAIVFVEGTHPDEKRRQENYKPPIIIRIITRVVEAIGIRFDKFKYSEDECFAETAQQIEVAGNFPPIPVAVITGKKSAPFSNQASHEVHIQCQKELISLSPHSTQILAKKSGHFPQITEPKLVSNAIKGIIGQLGQKG